MRTVLTGGTGVIGRAAVRTLLDSGHDVAVVTRSSAGAGVVESLGATPVPGNVLDVPSLVAAFEGAAAVINLAGKVPLGHGALLPGAWRRHDHLRTTGVANVVEAARLAGVRRVVQESSSVLYADQGEEWLTEQSPVEITQMTEPAAVGESLVQAFACDSRAGVVLRFGMIVGDERRTRSWTRAAASGRRLGLGRPNDWTHVIHIDDLGGAVLAALHAPSGVYNVGAEPVRRSALVQGYAGAVRHEPGPLLSALGRVMIRPRLEPLCRSLRVCGDHFSAQTGWRATRPRFEPAWITAAEPHLSA